MPFINGGHHVDVWDIGDIDSLIVILTILTITVAVSLLSRKGLVASAIRSLDRRVHSYLHIEYYITDEERDALYQEIVTREAELEKYNPKYVADYMHSSGLETTLEKVHKMHGDLA